MIIRLMVTSLASIAISYGTCLAQQEEPDIKTWESLAWTMDDSLASDIRDTRLVTGLFLSMYLAGAAVDSRYDLGSDLPPADATPDEAAAQAGVEYLTVYLQLDAGDLAQIDRLDERDDLVALGKLAAAQAFEMVAATTGPRTPYRPFVVPGRYVPTQIPRDVSTSNLQHFAFDARRATEIAPPPSPDSDRFVASYIETKRIGGRRSKVRTESEAKASLIFDLQDPHPMIFRILANRDLSLFEQARIMAIYDMGIEDVGAAQFAGKLHFQSWRPITAIRNGDLDNRDETEIDPYWAPLLETPNSSEYPCGHCTFVSATADLLDALLPLEPGERIIIKADDIYTRENNRGFDGDLVSYVEGFEMAYQSYADFAIAGAESRIHNGAHFRFSIDAGLALGKDVAQTVLNKWDGVSD